MDDLPRIYSTCWNSRDSQQQSLLIAPRPLSVTRLPLLIAAKAIPHNLQESFGFFPQDNIFPRIYNVTLASTQPIIQYFFGALTW